jgi:hypothetical protein
VFEWARERRVGARRSGATTGRTIAERVGGG